MRSGDRRLGPGRLSVHGMLSLEPWTIGRLVYAEGANGSPQRLFAFNDARERVPLADRRRPSRPAKAISARR